MIVKRTKLFYIIKDYITPFYHIAKWLYHHTIQRTPKSLGYIFMLHRVADFEEGHLWCNEHMKITPSFLDEQIELLKKEFDIISLTDVPLYLSKRNRRKFIVFTMDDGYKDNYTNALSIFKKHSVPYTIFVATDFPDRTAILWWYELEDLLLTNKSLTLSNGITYPANNYKEKCDSFLRIREEILKLNQLNLENELNNLFSYYKVDWYSHCHDLCLSWEDINELKKEHLVTIGAHTQHHFNLKQLSTSDEVKKEILSGTSILKEKAGIEPNVFAYPFGSQTEASEREFKIISELPFKCACVAYGGPCTKLNKKTIFSLPRIMFKEDFKIDDLR